MNQPGALELPAFARSRVNLASAGLGAGALSATDDFFAEVERMLQDTPAVFYPDRYDDHGKWMDGWESRRRRGPGHDHALVRLAASGRIDGFDVDTSHFTGNYPPACSIEACRSATAPDETTEWTELVPVTPLGPSAHHFLASPSDAVWTHVRLHIYPDGGVARLRVYGRPEIDLAAIGDGEIDLASSLNGGRIVNFSDAHYGAYHRLLAPGRGRDMGDGWETSRRRVPGNEWLIVRLGARAKIGRAVIDTAHYKGNFPESGSLEAADLSGFDDGLDAAIVTSSMFWQTLLSRRPLSADAEHAFAAGDIADTGPVTHVRLSIYPDGGVSRLRLFGRPA